MKIKKQVTMTRKKKDPIEIIKGLLHLLEDISDKKNLNEQDEYIDALKIIKIKN